METNTKSHSILCYITWIGWIVVLCIRNKEDEVVKHHLNQALVLNLAVTIVNIIARIGGDEFLVFCKDILDMSSVNEKVQTLFKKLESSPVGEDEKYIIRTSVGIAVSPQDGTTCKRLFDKADRNMYKVKRSGKNSYNF